MPQCCVVPLCSNRMSGHRFPKDPPLRKAWVDAIRRDRFEPTEYSRICKAHFVEDDYTLPKDSVREIPKPQLKKGAIPTVFAWTTKESKRSISRSKRAGNRNDYKEPVRKIQKEAGSLVSAHCSDFQRCEESTHPKNDVLMQGCGIKLEVTEDNNVHCNELVCAVYDEENNSDNVERKEFKTEHDEDLETVCPPLIAFKSEISDEINVSDKAPCSHSMRIADYKYVGKKAELKFYTGFESFDYFMFVFNLLGPAVNHLHYYTEYSPSGEQGVNNLLPVDQFFLTMVKLHRNMLNIELSFRFNVCEAVVTSILVTWLNFLYCQFKELDILSHASRETQSNLMKLKGEDGHSTVIIDCTEIKIDQPKNPLTQQQTFSTHKGCNTVKILLGISPTGTVSFISEAYGGSISVRQIFERCGILNKLKPNDVIMADRGFPIKDLVSRKDVKVVMPELVPALKAPLSEDCIPPLVPASKGQLKPEQLAQYEKVSSKRIHVERVIGLAKTYVILEGPLSANLVPLATRIVFVCFTLANLRTNVVM